MTVGVSHYLHSSQEVHFHVQPVVPIAYDNLLKIQTNEVNK